MCHKLNNRLEQEWERVVISDLENYAEQVEELLMRKYFCADDHVGYIFSIRMEQVANKKGVRVLDGTEPILLVLVNHLRLLEGKPVSKVREDRPIIDNAQLKRKTCSDRKEFLEESKSLAVKR